MLEVAYRRCERRGRLSIARLIAEHGCEDYGDLHARLGAPFPPRIGRVLIARGRDAADVAISTSFGPNTLTGFKVMTEKVVAT
jgi:hypothetical protein